MFERNNAKEKHLYICFGIKQASIKLKKKK